MKKWIILGFIIIAVGGYATAKADYYIRGSVGSATSNFGFDTASIIPQAGSNEVHNAVNFGETGGGVFITKSMGVEATFLRFGGVSFEDWNGGFGPGMVRRYYSSIVSGITVAGFAEKALFKYITVGGRAGVFMWGSETTFERVQGTSPPVRTDIDTNNATSGTSAIVGVYVKSQWNDHLSGRLDMFRTNAINADFTGVSFGLQYGF